MNDEEARALLLYMTARDAFTRPREQTIRMVKGYSSPGLDSQVAMETFWPMARTLHLLNSGESEDAERDASLVATALARLVGNEVAA